MVGLSASVDLPLHHKVQKFSSGTGSLGWSRKKGRKTVAVWCGVVWCGGGEGVLLLFQVLFFHTKPRDWLGEHLRNDPFCVEWDVKPQLDQRVSLNLL